MYKFKLENFESNCTLPSGRPSIQGNDKATWNIFQIEVEKLPEKLDFTEFSVIMGEEMWTLEGTVKEIVENVINFEIKLAKYFRLGA